MQRTWITLLALAAAACGPSERAPRDFVTASWSCSSPSLESGDTIDLNLKVNGDLEQAIAQHARSKSGLELQIDALVEGSWELANNDTLKLSIADVSLKSVLLNGEPPPPEHGPLAEALLGKLRAEHAGKITTYHVEQLTADRLKMTGTAGMALDCTH